MSNFFSDRLLRANSVIGSYDSAIGCYNITFPGLDTVCFDENVNGWITRKSYTPECAISLNDTYDQLYLPLPLEGQVSEQFPMSP